MENEIFRLKAEVLGALAHPLRIRILELLKSGTVCVCKIMPIVKGEQSNVSHHLAILRKAGVVGCEKRGLEMHYFISDKTVIDIIDLLDGMILRKLQKHSDVLKNIKKGK